MQRLKCSSRCPLFTSDDLIWTVLRGIKWSILLVNECAISLQLLHATAKGVISNLTRILPANILRTNGVTRLVLAGNAGKAPYVDYIKEFFDGFEVVANAEHSASAAYGAALFALKLDCK